MGTNLYFSVLLFFSCEQLSEMKCEKCNKQGDVLDKKKKGFIKRQAIAKLPQCLCIHIQRNCWSDHDYTMIKKSNFVQFSTNIQLNQVSNMFSFKQVGIGSLIGKKSMLESGNQSKSTNSVKQPTEDHIYELSSAIVHYGSAHSGHFVVYRKSLDNKHIWLQISDHNIKPVRLSTLLSNNVYMLFYDKTTRLK